MNESEMGTGRMLDWSRLLGFDQVQDSSSVAPPHAMVGDKRALQPETGDRANIQLKVGARVGTKAGSKVGNKPN